MTTTDPSTTADLIATSLARAEATRRGVDRILAALNEFECPECGWPTELRNCGVACVHCDWWWVA